YNKKMVYGSETPGNRASASPTSPISTGLRRWRILLSPSPGGKLVGLCSETSFCMLSTLFCVLIDLFQPDTWLPVPLGKTHDLAKQTTWPEHQHDKED